ncbi:MAG: M48 family metalloprotease, partial [Acidobacteria bacterium]|nr:M48 family metalloprotease [Acidobacteriota bacterium]
MTIAAGLPKMPDVYIIDKDALNAFATGRGPDRASIAVTSGLLEQLDRDELQGVVAHELGHVKNRDVLYLLLLGAMAGAIVILADVGRRVLWYGPPRRRTSDK